MNSRIKLYCIASLAVCLLVGATAYSQSFQPGVARTLGERY